MRNTVLLGDVIERLRELPENSIDAIVTDPPDGLEFMGKEWDGWSSPAAFGEWCRKWAVEALRVLKPGGHLLAFGGTRTYHRLVSGIEDAGFEIRDTIAWLYGSGFPKSLDVSKAIDKAAGAERTEVVGRGCHHGTGNGGPAAYIASAGKPYEPGDSAKGKPVLAPATDAAREWSGFGTALKPAHEPIVVARKPLIGTVAQNVQTYGTGALNIDGCRVGETVDSWPASRSYGAGTEYAFTHAPTGGRQSQSTGNVPPGRWPANVAHDGSVEVLELFPESGNGGGRPVITKRERNKGWCNSSPGEGVDAIDNYGDSGSAARFFYCAKASRADREAGLPVAEGRANDHPTVKPHDLMRWLVHLVGGQPGSLILDPFAGSGSTLRAARAEGFDFLGIERDRHYYRLACLRAGLPDPGEADEEMC